MKKPSYKKLEAPVPRPKIADCAEQSGSENDKDEDDAEEDVEEEE